MKMPPLKWIVPPATPLPDNEARLYAAICHLLGVGGLFVPVLGNVCGPLILWLLKRGQSPLVEDQGKESLNFQITVAFAGAVLLALGSASHPIQSLSLYGVLQLANVVFIIIAAVEAHKGVAYRHPFAVRFIP